jgi:tetratricopeptide (TPR) repeat protein
MNTTPDRPNQSGNRWLVAAIIFLFAFALLWSVDASFRYLGIGGFAFCIAQYLLIRWERREVHRNPYQRAERPKSANADSFIRSFKKLLGNTRRVNPKTLVGVFISSTFFLMFFFIVLGIIFGDESAVFSDEELVARDYYYAGKYDSALYHYKQALHEEPDNPYILVETGNCYLYLKRYDSALWHYDRALELDPENLNATHNRGLVFYQQQKYRDAIHEARKVLVENPSHLDALLLAGDSYYTQTLYDSALVFYQDAYNLGYRSAILTHIMAYINDVKGNTPQAIALYRETLEQDDSITDIYVRLGELLPGEEGQVYRTRAVQLQQGSGQTDW